MAIPNTDTFSLPDVVAEVVPTTNDLVDCFADAIASYFNSTYAGSKNSLLNFRDYGSHNVPSLTLFYRGTVGATSAVCGNSATIACWHDGAGALPVSGDMCYTDSGGVTSLPGGFTSYYPMKITSGTSNNWMQVNGVGSVLVVGSC